MPASRGIVPHHQATLCPGLASVTHPALPSAPVPAPQGQAPRPLALWPPPRALHLLLDLGFASAGSRPPSQDWPPSLPMALSRPQRPAWEGHDGEASTCQNLETVLEVPVACFADEGLGVGRSPSRAPQDPGGQRFHLSKEGPGTLLQGQAQWGAAGSPPGSPKLFFGHEHPRACGCIAHYSPETDGVLSTTGHGSVAQTPTPASP